MREESPFSYSLVSCGQYAACLVVEIFLSIYLQLPKKYQSEVIMCCSYFLKSSVLSSSVWLYLLALHKLKGNLEKPLREVYRTL